MNYIRLPVAIVERDYQQTAKRLRKAAKQRIAISEKVINLIIGQMNKLNKIEFTQKEGWKIKI